MAGLDPAIHVPDTGPSRAGRGVDHGVEPGDDDGEPEAMDFDLTEEQRLLRDSIERLLADRYGFDKRR